MFELAGLFELSEFELPGFYCSLMYCLRILQAGKSATAI